MENVEKLGIIPARYASTRFPGKPLAKIDGIPMIERVYRQAEKSKLDRIIVATDDKRIEKCVKDFGGNVVMTSPELATGTDRCRAALEVADIEAEYVINIQGDEPFVDPKQINVLLKLLHGHPVKIATLVSPAESMEEVQNPNRVKVTTDRQGKALYFSRLPIPYANDPKQIPANVGELYTIHLGIYGYQGDTLIELGELTPSGLELSENLEQLRWLENGYDIYTATTDERSDAVDTPEDLKSIEKKYFL